MTEVNNYFVSSRGLLKSCDYISQTPQSSTRQLINYPSFDIIKNIKNPTIYICSSAIQNFIQVLLSTINFKFILVSGDCDETIPNEILSSENFNKFINDDRLVHWFCQNIIAKHPKITIMPIGLDYHTMTTRDIWGPITSCLDQEKILNSIIKNSKPFYKREIKCYANFHFFMTTKYGYDRKDAFANINKEIVFYEQHHVSRLVTWNKQKEYAFVICPHGGGFDCHRNWEALCLGCIPIVKTSAIDHLYDDLHVLIVNNWNDITQELLEQTIARFKKKHKKNEFNYKKLSLKYWTHLFKSSIV
jgi:hypothetical protein